jgi:hypothetical protein
MMNNRNSESARLALKVLQAAEERKKRDNAITVAKEIMDNFNAGSYVQEIEACHRSLETTAKTQKKAVYVYMTTRSGREILVNRVSAGIGNSIMVRGMDDESVESHVLTNINTIELVFKVVAESNDTRSKTIVFN